MKFLWIANNSLLLISVQVLVLLLLLPNSQLSVAAEEEDVDESDLSSNLFAPPEEIQVLSPSQFPKPTHLIQGKPNVTVIVEPVFGRHRPNVDAIFAYAEGYELAYYMMFIETLGDTGFQGDYVLAISEPRMVKPHVMEYLQYQKRVNVVIYNHELSCLDLNGEPGHKRRPSSGGMDIFQMCQLAGVYGWKDKDGNVIEAAEDPREPRVVATLRYEWYWIWSLQYDPNVWILLIDARDSIFQSDPFASLPRQKDPKAMKDGLLYFFGENHEATRLGRSIKNRNWIRNGYGPEVLKALAEKPTICSGSTMGEQLALETYLRALVNEWDETDIGMTGSDQGFHNYLYYSRKLQNTETVREIIVWEQGKGIVNNLGALRTKTLKEWGIYDEEKHLIYNWDLKTLSPVAHQFDRDAAAHNWIVRQKFKQWTTSWLDGSYKEKTEKAAG